MGEAAAAEAARIAEEEAAAAEAARIAEEEAAAAEAARIAREEAAARVAAEEAAQAARVPKAEERMQATSAEILPRPKLSDSQPSFGNGMSLIKEEINGVLTAARESEKAKDAAEQ